MAGERHYAEPPETTDRLLDELLRLARDLRLRSFDADGARAGALALAISERLEAGDPLPTLWRRAPASDVDGRIERLTAQVAECIAELARLGKLVEPGQELR